MQPLFYDSFDRANAVLNTTAYPSTFGAASAGVATNVAKFATTGGHVVGASDMPVPNYTVEAVVRLDATDDRTGMVVLGARYNRSTGAHYGLALVKATCTYPKSDGTASNLTMSANFIRLVKSDGTTVTSLATAVAQTFSLSTNYRLRLVVSGTLIQGYVNDQLLITANDSTYSAPYAPAFGVRNKDSGGTTTFATFNDLIVNRMLGFVGIQTAYDELANTIKVSFPTSGSPGMQQILNYHLDTSDWTVDSLPTSCLFTLLADTRQKQVVYGNPSDGKLYLFDTTKTRASSAFTGTWTSNWIKIDSTLKKKAVVRAVKYLLSLSEVNSLSVSVEVADDPDDPATITTQQLVSGYESDIPIYVGQRGNYVRIGISDSGSTSTMKVRQIDVGLLR